MDAVHGSASPHRRLDLGDRQQRGLLHGQHERPARAHLDALQLGEGPHFNALITGAPVLVPDVRGAVAQATWPLFGNAVLGTPARGVYAFPLILGVSVVGVADLYSDAIGVDWPRATGRGRRPDRGVDRGPAVELATRSADSERSTPGGTAVELRREVHQATGMLIVQLGVPADAALARLQAHAFATGRPVLEVARDVVQRRLDFRGEAG